MTPNYDARLPAPRREIKKRRCKNVDQEADLDGVRAEEHGHGKVLHELDERDAEEDDHRDQHARDLGPEPEALPDVVRLGPLLLRPALPEAPALWGPLASVLHDRADPRLVPVGARAVTALLRVGDVVLVDLVLVAVLVELVRRRGLDPEVDRARDERRDLHATQSRGRLSHAHTLSSKRKSRTSPP